MRTSPRERKRGGVNFLAVILFQLCLDDPLFLLSIGGRIGVHSPIPDVNAK